MLTVVPATNDLRRHALTLLYARLPIGEREPQLAAMLAALQRGDLVLDDLLVAREGESMVGTVLAVRQPGRTAFLWPPVAAHPDQERGIADELLLAMARRLDAAGVLFTQSVLELEEGSQRDALQRNGFLYQTDLLFLHRSLGEPLPDPADSSWATIPYEERCHDRFARLIERSYVGTLDCPVLYGLRGGEEALAAHRAAGTFDPSRWQLFQSPETGTGEDLGVLLLTEWPENKAWEVTYLGVAPEARGRGLGRAMMESGLQQARQAGAETMLLTVDSRNHYAIRIYTELGFTLWGSRAVHLRLHPNRPVAQ